MKKSDIPVLLERLDNEYGRDIPCYLDYMEPWQLLIATILSAQCTDARVNMVTPDLFRRYPDVKAMADADREELEQLIRSTGFYRNKAANIIACCRKLVSEYDGEVPSDIDALTSLPGVGRKTANVIRGHIFHEASVVVDTHVGRLARRLGLSKSEDPEKVEYDLMEKLPKDHWIACNTQLIALGRSICTSRSPKCTECFLNDICPFAKRSEQAKKSRS